MTSFVTEAQQRWQAWQPTKTQAFWFCVVAVIAALIGGFGIAGWVTQGTARQMARDAADEARRTLAVNVCVEDFMQAANAKERLAKLKSVDYYSRGDILATGGFATMPGEKEADGYVAARCAAALEEVKAPAPKS